MSTKVNYKIYMNVQNRKLNGELEDKIQKVSKPYTFSVNPGPSA